MDVGTWVCVLVIASGATDAPVECPDGALLHGAAPPAGTRVWCARDAERHGPMLAWHNNGELKVRGQYRDGQKTGLWAYWHQNGRRRAEGEHVAGRPHGPWSWWFDNARLAETGGFRGGFENGEWMAWHDNGRIRESGNWVDGARQGWWSEWDESGRKLRDLRYEDDELIDTLSGSDRRARSSDCVVEAGELYCRRGPSLWLGFGATPFWDPYWNSYWGSGSGFVYPSYGRHRAWRGRHRQRPGHRHPRPGSSPRTLERTGRHRH